MRHTRFTHLTPPNSRESRSRLGVVAIATALAVAACEAVTPVDILPTKGRVTLSVSPGTGVVATPQNSNLTASSDLIQILSGDTLVMTRVAVVLREMELKRQFASGCSVGEPSGESCQRFAVGPLLVEIPVVGGLTPVVTIDVPPGMYDEVEFEIHKPEHDNPTDNAFLLANPDFEDVSVRVEGTFNGQPFVFLQDLGETREADLVPPLLVTDENPAATNLTLAIDVSRWFVSPSGLINPSTANKGGDNEDIVEDNIEDSIEAFEDRDRDGRKDDG